MSTLPYPLQSFAQHLADGLKEVEMKNLDNLQAVADQIENQYSVDHTRIIKAIELVKLQAIRKLSNGNWQVPSAEDANHLYQVNTEHPRCNCLDYARQSVKDPAHVCKHLASALIWQALPDAKVIPQELQSLYAQLGLKTLVPAQ